MNLVYFLKKMVHLILNTLLNKIFLKIADKARYQLFRFIDFNSDTRIKRDIKIIDFSFVSVNEIDVSKIDSEIAVYLSDMYLKHRFDLLGSGWLKNSYEGEATGIEGIKYDSNLKKIAIDKNKEWLEKILIKSHIPSAKKIWKSLKHDFGRYQPIDWQRDFKSGYRWSSRKYYKEQRIGFAIGADIKMPWELSRLQHLPQMAIFAYKLSGNGQLKDKLVLEFMNQFLDFTATNPPRMGANWTCTMDVGIRAANLLIAYDLFSQIDTSMLIDDDFKRFFSNSIYEHGFHIINNLEYSHQLTSNHYLSDIAGLLFISAYLETTDENILWLAFAIQEFINEVKKQFYEDGANFEASTSYHRLSGEIVVYCAALIMGLSGLKIAALKNYDNKKRKFCPELKGLNEQEYKIECGSISLPEWLTTRIYKAGFFTLDITKPTGEIPQIGDNDSGRFFRFSPNGTLVKVKDAIKKYKNLKSYRNYENLDNFYWDENAIDHSTYVASVDGLYDEAAFINCSNLFPLEKSFIKSILNRGEYKKNLNIAVCSDLHIWQNEISTSDRDLNRLSLEVKKLNFHKKSVIFNDTKPAIPLTQNLRFKAYNDFGMFIYKSDRLYLAIFAGPNGQNGNGGHAHNDKLSFELNIDRSDIIVDAGTYLYTPLPERRNLFRSVKAHSVPIFKDKEQNRWIDGTKGLFSMSDSTKCEILSFSVNNFTIKLTYDIIIHIRSFIIAPDEIQIEDYSNYQFETNFNNFKLYSNGYGKLIYG